MSTDPLNSTMATLRTAGIPILTGLMGTMGIANGLYSFNAPFQFTRTFGILARGSDSTSKSGGVTAGAADAAHSPAIQSWQRSYVHVQGVRNFAGGLSIVGITAFWRFSTICQTSPVAALAAKRCLGIIFLTGSLIGAGDGLIIRQFGDAEGVSGEAREIAKKTGAGHLVMAIPILALGLTCFFT